MGEPRRSEQQIDDSAAVGISRIGEVQEVEMQGLAGLNRAFAAVWG